MKSEERMVNSEGAEFGEFSQLIQSHRQNVQTKLVTLSRELLFETENAFDEPLGFDFSRIRSPFQGSLVLHHSFLRRCPRLTYLAPLGRRVASHLFPNGRCSLSFESAECSHDRIVSTLLTLFHLNAPKGQLYVSPGCKPGKQILKI